MGKIGRNMWQLLDSKRQAFCGSIGAPRVIRIPIDAQLILAIPHQKKLYIELPQEFGEHPPVFPNGHKVDMSSSISHWVDCISLLMMASDIPIFFGWILLSSDYIPASIFWV